MVNVIPTSLPTIVQLGSLGTHSTTVKCNPCKLTEEKNISIRRALYKTPSGWNTDIQYIK